MSSAPTAAHIAKDARWLVQAIDPPTEAVRLVEMDAAAYRAESFLDDRMFMAPRNVHVRPWQDVARAVPVNARRDARWILHIGHVGSTLASRLLGEIEGVLALREPRALRDLAAMPPGQRAGYMEPLQRLLSRAFAPGETALVKATSFVSEIAAELVPPGTPVMFMYATPRAYIQGILAGENSRKETAVLADSRAARMAGRVPGLAIAERADARAAAAAWACEMTSLEQAAEALPDGTVLWVDFDRMLERLNDGLAEAARFLGFATTPDRLEEIAGGPLLSRYSKGLEYDYSPALRRDLLAEAEDMHGPDIDSALAMLVGAAETSPLLARALRRANPEG